VDHHSSAFALGLDRAVFLDWNQEDLADKSRIGWGLFASWSLEYMNHGGLPDSRQHKIMSKVAQILRRSAVLGAAGVGISFPNRRRFSGRPSCRLTSAGSRHPPHFGGRRRGVHRGERRRAGGCGCERGTRQAVGRYFSNVRYHLTL
jgi:hypothetical protein